MLETIPARHCRGPRFGILPFDPGIESQDISCLGCFRKRFIIIHFMDRTSRQANNPQER